jgi:hypothetical protein
MEQPPPKRRLPQSPHDINRLMSLSRRNNTALLTRDRSERRTGRLIKVMHHIPNDRQSQFMPRSIDIVGYIPYKVVSATSIPTIHVSIRQNLVYHWIRLSYRGGYLQHIIIVVVQLRLTVQQTLAYTEDSTASSF